MRVLDMSKVCASITKHCSVCNKLFILAPQHMYKTYDNRSNVQYQCSYSHYREAGGDKGVYGQQQPRKSRKNK